MPLTSKTERADDNVFCRSNRNAIAFWNENGIWLMRQDETVTMGPKRLRQCGGAMSKEYDKILDAH